MNVGGKITSSRAWACLNVSALFYPLAMSSLRYTSFGNAFGFGAILGGIGFLVIEIGLFFGLFEPGALI